MPLSRRSKSRISPNIINGAGNFTMDNEKDFKN